MTQGFGGFLLFMGGGCCGCGAGCRAGGDPGFRCVLCLPIMQIKKIKLNKKLKVFQAFVESLATACLLGVYGLLSGRDLDPDETVCDTSCWGDVTHAGFLRTFLSFSSPIPDICNRP